MSPKPISSMLFPERRCRDQRPWQWSPRTRCRRIDCNRLLKNACHSFSHIQRHMMVGGLWMGLILSSFFAESLQAAEGQGRKEKMSNGLFHLSDEEFFTNPEKNEDKVMDW